MLTFIALVSIWSRIASSAHISAEDMSKVLIAEITCCPQHKTDYNCVGEPGSQCIWLDPMDPIVMAGMPRCVGRAWAQCKTLNINAMCANRHPTFNGIVFEFNPSCGTTPPSPTTAPSPSPTAPTTAPPTTQLQHDIMQLQSGEIDQNSVCKATVFANGADLLTISASTDGGATFTQLSFSADYRETARHMIEDVDTNTIIQFKVDTATGNHANGGFLADVRLKNSNTGKAVRMYTNNPLDVFTTKKGGEVLVSTAIAESQRVINNPNRFSPGAQWIWDETGSKSMIFQINFGEEDNIKLLIDNGYGLPSYVGISC